MAIDIPRPNITATTEAGRFEQVRSYLYQMAEQLNYALNTVETKMETVVLETAKQSSSETSPEAVQSNFNSIKALIIKSADIVNAYSEVIEKKLEGRYMASSAFGDYTEETIKTLIDNEKVNKQEIENVQKIFDENGNIKAELLVNGHIYSGIIEYAKDGEAIVGIEIGQISTVNGKETFKKFARFTSDKLAFYNSNGDEMGYISDSTLYITHARFGGYIHHGGYRIDPFDGIAYIWEEGE